MTKEALKLALEALDKYGFAPCDKEEDWQGFKRAITAIKEVLAQPEQEPVAWRDHVEQRLLTWRQSFVNKSGDQLALDDFMDKRSLDDLIEFVCDAYTTPSQPEQEPVAWGVDWGKAGDIPCVSIIKRLPDGGIKVLAVEYAPYSYTTSPKQEPVRIMGFNCKCGRRMEVSAEQGVVPAPQRSESSGKPAAWVGLTDEERGQVINANISTGLWSMAKDIEAKLKQKNGYTEENT